MRKVLILTLLVFLFSWSRCFSEGTRRSAVEGSFYPADAKRLRGEINLFLSNAKKIDAEGRPIAIIVPHAGYVYSGRVAAHGFKQLKGRKVGTAVIICNSHTAYFQDIAVDDSEAWETPLGMVNVNKELGDSLVSSDGAIRYNGKAHKKDHTIEVQLPFLQVVLEKDFEIVPILFGNYHDDSYKKLARALADNLGKDDIIIVSTDMSHYPAFEDANRVDGKTLRIIRQADIAELERHVEEVRRKRIPGEETVLCGIDGVKTALELYNISGGSDIKILKYANSGDMRGGDKTRVVGYGSVLMLVSGDSQAEKEAVMNDEYLNLEEKQRLMSIARGSILEAVTGRRQPESEIEKGPLKEKCGAFVTIKKHGKLRGCIGYIVAVKPLYETVRDVAKSAAVSDPRFNPVSKDELDDIELEISVLTPLKRIKDAEEEVTVGKHGLYMKRGFNSGLLLPQVPTEYSWDKETFLEHTCLKAGLPRTAWKDDSTEIYIFSAEVFGEKDIQ